MRFHLKNHKSFTSVSVWFYGYSSIHNSPLNRSSNAIPPIARATPATKLSPALTATTSCLAAGVTKSGTVIGVRLLDFRQPNYSIENFFVKSNSNKTFSIGRSGATSNYASRARKSVILANVITTTRKLQRRALLHQRRATMPKPRNSSSPRSVVLERVGGHPEYLAFLQDYLCTTKYMSPEPSWMQQQCRHSHFALVPL
jgi:hypothetical protein